MIPIPSGVLPVRELSTLDVLYGERVTSYRWEVLNHAGGVDTLAGYLDGVEEQSAHLSWTLYNAVKGEGSINVHDLAEAKEGFLRLADLTLTAARIRPVLVVEGLPEIPLGAYLFTAAPEQWTGAGRVHQLELHDRNTVLDQDAVPASYSVPAGTRILAAVAQVIAEAGESITVDAGELAELANPMVWPAGTTRLQIVNDLLDAAGYSSLWVDGVGNYRATPYVLPAARSTRYELLNAQRELVDGRNSIYSEAWARDRDLFGVPNRVLAIQSGSGDEEPLIGIAENTDPTSPFSYPARGRWITKVLDGVEVPDGDPEDQQAFLDAKARASLVASSSVQAEITVQHLPIPVRVSDVLRFRNVPAGIDARHVLTKLELDANPTGLMTSTLQEVVDL